MLTVGGQCEGYGGIFEGLRMVLPVQHCWLAEIDPDANAVLSCRYPAAKNLGDITAVDWRAVERPDILTSGFPCQSFSECGKRRGGTDPRYLWPTGVFPAIDALRPSLVILENVRGLLSIDGGAIFGGILADFDDAGYAVSWVTVGACMVEACHHRHRVFVVASRDGGCSPGDGDPVAVLAARGWMSPRAPLFGADDAPRWPVSGGIMTGGQVWAAPVSTCIAPGSTLVPTVRKNDNTGRCRHGDGGLDLPTAVANMPFQRGRYGVYTKAVRRQEAAFGFCAPAPYEPGRNGQNRVTGPFVEWMQGLPPGWITDVVDPIGAVVRLAGNGVVPRQCAYALSVSPAFRSWTQHNAPVMTHGGV